MPGRPVDDPDSRVVGLFIPHLGIGGAELQLGLLASRLRGVGWMPFVATIQDLHGIARRFADAGVDVEFLPRNRRSGWDTVTALARVIRRRRARLVHAWLWAANWRAAVAHLLAPGVPVIASIRSLEEDLSAANFVAYRALSPLIEAIIVNSNAVLENSATRTGIPREKYYLVRNGVELADPDRRIPTGDARVETSGPVIGYVGTLHARKRAGSLAAIASGILAREPAARFLVVGDGPERERLLGECGRLGVTDRFEFAGYREDVRTFLRRMDVLIHPSRNEGSSNSILEAMSVGVPVVAYDVSGNRETVASGETGILVPDDRPDDLSRAVADLLADRDRRRRFGEASRERIRREFSVEGMVRSTVDVYDACARRR